MNYVDQLPPFDPAIHLTSADLRDIERACGYGDLPNSLEGINPHGASGQKIAKHAYETRLCTELCLRFCESSRAHPPYGLVAPPPLPSMIIAPEPMRVETRHFTPEETAMMQTVGSMRTLHAVSDLKLQVILNEMLLERAADDDYLKAKIAGDANARTVTAGRSENWKQVLQAAASNAKRSEFIVLKQILVQWMRTIGRLPTPAEFQDVATNSLSLLEMLATTHQAVFKTLNGRIILDDTAGNHHRLVNKSGKGQLALLKRITNNMSIERGHPKTRTMCAAFTAKGDDGVSLLEHSFREDTAIIAGALYHDGEPRADVFASMAKERLPEPSVQMFLKLKGYEVHIEPRT